MPRLLAALRDRSPFLLLWSGQTISAFGSQISALALPLTAILILKATPGQMGILLALLRSPVPAIRKSA